MTFLAFALDLFLRIPFSVGMFWEIILSLARRQGVTRSIASQVDTYGRACDHYAQPGVCDTDGEFYTPSAALGGLCGGRREHRSELAVCRKWVDGPSCWWLQHLKVYGCWCFLLFVRFCHCNPRPRILSLDGLLCLRFCLSLETANRRRFLGQVAVIFSANTLWMSCLPTNRRKEEFAPTQTLFVLHFPPGWKFLAVSSKQRILYDYSMYSNSLCTRCRRDQNTRVCLRREAQSAQHFVRFHGRKGTDFQFWGQSATNVMEFWNPNFRTAGNPTFSHLFLGSGSMESWPSFVTRFLW